MKAAVVADESSLIASHQNATFRAAPIRCDQPAASSTFRVSKARATLASRLDAPDTCSIEALLAATLQPFVTAIVMLRQSKHCWTSAVDHLTPQMTIGALPMPLRPPAVDSRLR
ncbi:MAG: hypothetical protein FJX06_16715 [Alphaproteobacteria bacterium]|nr:hypothetical protein [Alphaproteobacteria bacterium]